jgi:Flp pilus assembly protein TadG
MIAASNHKPPHAPGGPETSSPRRTRQRRGAAAVEFAVLAPLMGVILMGTMEMSRAMMAKIILNDAARKACRTGILPTGSNTAIDSEVSNILADNNVNAASATVTILVNDQAVDASTAKQNDKVSVKVAVPYAQFAWAPPLFLGNRAVESETVVMMRQR